MTVTLHRLRRPRLLLSLLALLVVLPAVPAQASSTAVLRDCQDGSLTGRYSQSDYAAALRDIPTDVDEYTDCRSLIRSAQLGAAGGRSTTGSGGGTSGAAGAGGTGGTGGGSGSGGGTGGTGAGAAGDALAGVPNALTANGVLANATPKERAAVAAAAGGAGGPVRAGSAVIRPEQLVSGVGLGRADLPTSVLVSLLGLGLAALLALTWWGKSRVDARRAAHP